MITLKPLWASPGTELSTWYIGSFCCIRAIQRTCIASRPLRSYTAIQRYTLYSYFIHRYTLLYTTYATPLWQLVQRRNLPDTPCGALGYFTYLAWTGQQEAARRRRRLFAVKK